jgi:hypothetical protein
MKRSIFSSASGCRQERIISRVAVSSGSQRAGFCELFDGNETTPYFDARRTSSANCGCTVGSPPPHSSAVTMTSSSIVW